MDEWCMKHLSMPLQRAKRITSQDALRSSKSLLPKPCNFPEVWRLKEDNVDGETAKNVLIRLAKTYCARVLTRRHHLMCVDKINLWNVMWMLHVYVTRMAPPGTLTLTDLRGWLVVALYISIKFENGNVISCSELDVSEEQVHNGLRHLPSPFGFPLRQQLFDRFNTHYVKQALALWLEHHQGRPVREGLARVFARNITLISEGRVPAQRDVFFLWRCVRR